MGMGGDSGGTAYIQETYTAAQVEFQARIGRETLTEDIEGIVEEIEFQGREVVEEEDAAEGEGIGLLMVCRIGKEIRRLCKEYKTGRQNLIKAGMNPNNYDGQIIKPLKDTFSLFKERGYFHLLREEFGRERRREGIGV